MVEKRFFAVDPPTIAGKPSIRANRPVAWDQQRDGVASASTSDGPWRAGFADCLGELGVGAGFPVGNIAQGPPYLTLKSRGLNIERQLDVRLMAFEMRDHGIQHVAKAFVIAVPFSLWEVRRQIRDKGVVVIAKPDKTHALGGRAHED